MTPLRSKVDFYGKLLKPLFEVRLFTSYLHKAERAKRQDFLDELLKLDETHAVSPSLALYKKRLLLQSEYDGFEDTCCRETTAAI